MYLEDKFVSYAQALETYHRRIIKTNRIDPKECIKMGKIAIKHIPPGLRTHFWQKIKYAHEPSLRSRLKEIVNLNLPLKEKLFSNNQKVNRFIKII